MTGSIVAASLGKTLNEKVPPGVPVNVTVPPSQEGVVVNVASSATTAVTV